MVSAIGSAFASPTVSDPAATAAGIEAQVARYKKELSDCVNCESAKTTAGKAEIAALAGKISAAEARIEKISAGRPRSEPAASPLADDATTRASADATGLDPGNTQRGGQQSASVTSANPARRGRIDIYA
ncbi:MAG: hypothetical protein ACLGHA_03935 [Gammaproteobacteria bacterium]